MDTFLCSLRRTVARPRSTCWWSPSDRLWGHAELRQPSRTIAAVWWNDSAVTAWVSGAQFLAAAGVQVALIQLLGRWSSSAVERYIQHAPLSMVPQIPSEVLTHSGPQRSTAGGTVGTAVGPAPATPAPTPARDDGRNLPSQSLQGRFISDPEEGRSGQAQLTAQRRRLKSLQGEVASLRKAIKPPSEVLVVRPRSSVVHRSVIDEHHNPPDTWRSVCGWKYGCTRFFRVGVVSDTQRFCKKCFEDSERPESDGAEDSKEDSDTSSSGSSSSDPSSWHAGMSKNMLAIPRVNRFPFFWGVDLEFFLEVGCFDFFLVESLS